MKVLMSRKLLDGKYLTRKEIKDVFITVSTESPIEDKILEKLVQFTSVNLTVLANERYDLAEEITLAANQAVMDYLDYEENHDKFCDEIVADCKEIIKHNS
jgi:hypothetical protein